MATCIIIAPLFDDVMDEWLCKQDGDCIICADGGYAAARKYGILPDVVIGDFDSMPLPEQLDCDVQVLPVRKDDTDLVVCLKEGRVRGYTRFIIAGALGGRIDHTIAAMQCIRDCAVRGEEAWLIDGYNRLRVLTPGVYELNQWLVSGRNLSLLAASPKVEGVELIGADWELHDAVLTDTYPLGISNAVKGNVRLSFTKGLLYLGSCEDGRHGNRA